MLKQNMYTLCFGVFLLLFGAISAMKTSRLHFNISDYKRCLATDTVMRTILRVSIKSCVEECVARNGKCKAVNYRKRFNLCELLDTDVGDMVENNSKSGACVFVTMADTSMNTLSNMCECDMNAGESCDIDTYDCSVTECPGLFLGHGTIMGNLHEVGSVLTFYCDQQYVEINYRTSSTCLANGNWSYEPECIIDCGLPPEVMNAIISPDSTLQHAIGTYNCTDGFESVPEGVTMETTCERTGKWSPIFFTCVVDCGLPPEVMNAIISPDLTLQHAIGTYNCTDGFASVPEGVTMETTCEITGQWSPIFFTCIVDCGLPTEVMNAIISPDSTLQHAIGTYSCTDGFVSVPEGATMETTCEHTGQWSPIFFTCVVDCGLPPEVMNAIISPDSTLQHAIGTYSCTDGFASVPEGVTMETTCESTGQWSPIFFTCVVDCGLPTEVMNAIISPDSTLQHAIVTYSCTDGFVSVPEGATMETTCENTGQWSPIFFTCVVDCGLPPEVMNAIISPDSTLQHAIGTYSCTGGFASVPEGATMETTCESTGQWSPIFFTCVVDCGPPPEISDAVLLPGSNLQDANRTYYCTDGFAPVPVGVAMKTTCKTIGQWSAILFTCVVDCGTSPAMANAYISVGTTTIDSTRTYDCQSGSISNNVDSTITCLETGQWTSTYFYCLETSIGNYCSEIWACIGTGAVCISNACLCGPLYRYKSLVNDCVQVCTVLTDDFEYFEDQNINGFNELDYVDNITETQCIAMCKSNSECRSVDYFREGIGRCYLSFVTYYMILDVLSSSIRNMSDVFVASKTCT